MAWEPVWSGSSETEAEIIAGRLRAERVRTRVVAGAGPIRSTYAAQAGQTWYVVAAARQAEGARRLLEERETAGITHLEDFADPVATNWRQMRRAWPWFLAAALVGSVFVLVTQLEG